MKRFVYVLCLVVILSTTAFARGGRRSGGSGGSGESTSASQNATIDKAPTYKVEIQLLEAINVVRVRHGLRALVLDRTLHLSARQHCGWMANSRRMVHSSGHAENIAMGQADVDAVMDAWMNSSGHRANILNPSYTKVGLSGYMSPSGSPFWCQQFE